jgi:FAD dependent oxidoreductase
MTTQTKQSDIAIIGGGMGGVAAALAACDAGMSVVLTEPTDWLGGQMTSQGTSALDEHRYIEYFGGTRSYYQLRERIRDHYRQRFGISSMPDGKPLNPGNGWVSNLCFEPIVGVQAIQAMLQPHIDAGKLTIMYGYEPIAAEVQGDSIVSIQVAQYHGTRRQEDNERDNSPNSDDLAVSTFQRFNVSTLIARLFLDATELGDLLPLVGAESVTGAESYADTGEPFAPHGPARPTEVQSFTFPFAVEYCPGEHHTIAKPDRYEHFREQQPYTLTLTHRSGPARLFCMFAEGPTGLPPFWTYRRILDGAFDSRGNIRDIAMINWPGNDYHYGDLVGATAAERNAMLEDAKLLAMGFLYWLQTECPRDDGTGIGYPEIRVVPEAMGTSDGLAKAPYIRESRRIIAKQRITANDILDTGQESPYAREYPDSVGVGWYHMDVHPANGNLIDRYEPTKPFQIPLGALIPIRITNLLACCKNIGTTHLSNGAYRLHPVEWNLGESAGTLAAFCCSHGHTPADVHSNPQLIRQLQELLRFRDIPLNWRMMPNTPE